MAMSATDDLLANAARYAESFALGDLPLPPAKSLAVVACMDSRMDIFGLLGLQVGDAHVIRNAGGVVTDDTVRSLSISQHLLGTKEIVLLQHTNCGLLTITDEEFADRLEAESGSRPDWAAAAFTSLEESVRESIAKIKASPFIPRTESVRGFVYDVETGALTEVI